MKKLFTLFTLLLLVVQIKAAETGIASFYCTKTNGGTRTASGIPLRNYELTAAHKTLPMGTFVKVTCLNTNKSVVVRITDRGPYIKGRIIDLSLGAAAKIGLTPKKGLTRVKVEKVSS